MGAGAYPEAFPSIFRNGFQMRIWRNQPHRVDQVEQFGNVFGAVVAVFGEEAED